MKFTSPERFSKTSRNPATFPQLRPCCGMKNVPDFHVTRSGASCKNNLGNFRWILSTNLVPPYVFPKRPVISRRQDNCYVLRNKKMSKIISLPKPFRAVCPFRADFAGPAVHLPGCRNVLPYQFASISQRARKYFPRIRARFIAVVTRRVRTAFWPALP